MFGPHLSALRILLPCAVTALLTGSHLLAQTGPARTTSSGAPSRTPSCRTSCHPFGISLVGCQDCNNRCTSPPSILPSEEFDDETFEPLPPAGDLQLNETFAALTGSGFAVSAPNMIGDNLGGASVPIYPFLYREGPIQSEETFELGSGTGGAVVGRVKLADNNSPLPRDRVFFDYNYFHNARIIAGGKSVNRFTPGFEKTFLDGLASFEFRVPMLATLDSDLRLDGNNQVMNAHNNEFGNLTMILKGLLWYDQSVAISGGMGITVPTADDLRLYDSFDTELLRIQNETVYLTPYLAFLCTPNDTFFYQAFLGIDVAANGNQVSVNEFQTGMRPIGRFTDQSLLMVDLAVGAWLFRDRFETRGLSGLATMMEVHYNQTLGAMDSVEGDFVAVGAIDGNRRERAFVNMTAGLTALFGQRTTATVGYGTPISSDRLFDGELRAFLNRYF
jgi:hypothetical protein